MLRKPNQAKRAAVVGLSKKEAFQLLTFGVTGDEAFVREFILKERRSPPDETMEAYEAGAGPDAAALKRIAREFLAVWLAHATPAQLRSLAGWMETHPEVTDWASLLVDMPRQKAALVAADGTGCTGTIVESNGKVAGVIWTSPDGVLVENFKPQGFEHYKTYLARQTYEDMLAYLAEHGFTVTVDALRKCLEELGVPRPHRRRNPNGTLV